MRKLFTKLLALLPKDSDGLELAEYGITWEIFKLDSGSPMLRIRWGGLEIYVMIDSDKPRYGIKDEVTKQALVDYSMVLYAGPNGFRRYALCEKCRAEMEKPRNLEHERHGRTRKTRKSQEYQTLLVK